MLYLQVKTGTIPGNKKPRELLPGVGGGED